MNGLPISILYSQDRVLRQRLYGFLLDRSTVHLVEDTSELRLMLQRHPSVLLFADLCATTCAPLLPALRREFPETVVVALGDARSDPGIMAAAAGIYGIEAPDADRLRIQALFDQVQMHIKLRTENRMLRDELQQPVTAATPQRESITPSLYHFTGALRRFDNIGMMLESIVEGVAGCARVSRVAVFSITASGLYRFRAGVKCMEQSRMLAYGVSDPIIQWLRIHAHSISRAMLRHCETIEERAMLEETLDLQGAEVILPMFGRERLIGWLSLGRSASGVPFEQRDIEELSMLAEQVSVTIENALLHDTLAVQKALAENLLQAIPAGIVAIGPGGDIRWFNNGAEQLLGVSAESMIDRPAGRLHGGIASLLNRCIAGEKMIGPVEWKDPLNRRDISIQARRLQQNGLCMGAMAVLKDLTEDRIFREKQSNLERAEFWNELASAISHEVRNPLVAISTFAQLLPERYADEEFRTQFRDLTIQEVERLNAMTDQLDLFANPPSLQFVPTEAAALLNAALIKIRTADGARRDVSISVAADLPLLRADADVLSSAIAHLLDNAFEAVAGGDEPRISMTATPGQVGAGRQAVLIEVRDNGQGIPDALADKIFSPFYTTKARGVGLGLAIVRRTMIDHEGLIDIESGTTGTIVRLTVPACQDNPESTPA